MSNGDEYLNISKYSYVEYSYDEWWYSNIDNDILSNLKSKQQLNKTLFKKFWQLM